MSTRHTSVLAAGNEVAEAATSYAETLNAMVAAGDVTSPQATAAILNALSNLVTVQNHSITVLTAAVVVLARDAGRMDVAEGGDGFVAP